MYFVYILLCADSSLYTGIAANPRQRFLAHQKGQGGAYTRAHPPLKIIYTKRFPNKSSALKQETLIKSWPRKNKIENLNLKF